MITELKSDEYNNILDLAKTIKKDFSTESISPLEKVIVYISKGKIIAFLQYFRNYETVDIINIAVLNEYKRKGVGTKLLNYIKKSDGIDHIMLEVRESNITAINFYKKNGFNIIREIKNYYENENALVMEMNL